MLYLMQSKLIQLKNDGICKKPSNIVISNFVNNVKWDFNIQAKKEPHPEDNKSVKVIHRNKGQQHTVIPDRHDLIQ